MRSLPQFIIYIYPGYVKSKFEYNKTEANFDILPDKLRLIFHIFVRLTSGNLELQINYEANNLIHSFNAQ